MSQYTWGEDLALQFFRGYLLAKCCASLAGFLPEMKGLEDIQAVKMNKIPYNTPSSWARPG